VVADGGRVVKNTGDGTLVEFPSAVDAVRNAVHTQIAIRDLNRDVPESQRIVYRVGINVGDIIVEDEDIFGDGVNVAARLEGLCAPGEVYVSGTVYDQVRDKLDITFKDLGPQTVKNIANPVRVYHAYANDGTDMAVSTPVSTIASKSEPRKRADGPSVIVLPFDNQSNDADQEFFSDGISEDLITDLLKLTGLFVVSRNTAFAYKGQTPDVGELGKTLGVAHVLEGSVRKAGNRVRINAQLTETATGGHVWADRYDGALDDIFALQDEITAKIVAVLQVKLTAQEATRPRQRITDNVEAYEVYLRARSEWHRLDPEGTLAALHLMRGAIEIDPDFAAAHAELSGVLQQGWSFVFPGFEEAFDEMLDAARRAVDLDDELPQAHSRLGWALIFSGHYDEAITSLERAIALGPFDSETHLWFGEALNYAGDPARGAQIGARAFELEPGANGIFHFCSGHSHYLLRNYDRAVDLFAGAIARAPGFPLPYLFLGIVYFELGRTDEAAVQFAKLHSVLPPQVLDVLVGRLPYRDDEPKHRMRDALERGGKTV
jgi:adenylate cyclase